MNTFESQRHDLLKRMWQERTLSTIDTSRFVAKTTAKNRQSFSCGPLDDDDEDDDMVSRVVPQVTVVLEGRSIGHRISLHKHASYHSLAKALRQMFADGADVAAADDSIEVVDLSNAVPGHLIAYEDMENDLLLVGDLNWKDFVRVAKRIRIRPVKTISSKKGRERI